MTAPLPTRDAAKAAARALRQCLADQGDAISHGQALDRVARHHGFRDWNTLSAAMDDSPPARLVAGARLSGRYLSRPFTATVLGVENPRRGWFRVVLDLDSPVDVVTFDSFSNLRKRIRGTIGLDGRSQETTSDGTPHLALDL
jgi:hypothetical protein